MSTTGDDDKKAILDHIDSIFNAFIRQDREALRRTHTADWIGFQGPSTSIERGIDAYMKNAETSLQHFTGTGYEMLDSEVQVHGDVAIVFYVARYDYRDGKGDAASIPLRSVDIYQRVRGEWIQAGSHITPIPTGGSWGESS